MKKVFWDSRLKRVLFLSFIPSKAHKRFSLSVEISNFLLRCCNRHHFFPHILFNLISMKKLWKFLCSIFVLPIWFYFSSFYLCSHETYYFNVSCLFNTHSSNIPSSPTPSVDPSHLSNAGWNIHNFISILFPYLLVGTFYVVDCKRREKKTLIDSKR